VNDPDPAAQPFRRPSLRSGLLKGWAAGSSHDLPSKTKVSWFANYRICPALLTPRQQWKWPSIITLVDYPNQNPPTDSADEATKALNIRERIEALEQELFAIGSSTDTPKRRGRPPAPISAKIVRKRRKMSPDQRAKIAAAARARWARHRAANAK